MKRRGAIRLLAAGIAAAGTGAFVREKILAPLPSAKLLSVDELTRRLYESFDDEDRRRACVAYDHPLRQFHNRGVPGGGAEVVALDHAQRQLVTDLFYAGLSYEGQKRLPHEYYLRFPGVHAMRVLVCGEPSSSHQVILSGPHLNLRVGGASAEGAAFGGPQVYGDQRGDEQPGLPGNLYGYQLQAFWDLFNKLDAPARERATLPTSPVQTDIEPRGTGAEPRGVVVDARDASALVDAVLANYPDDDAAYARACIAQGGPLTFSTYADGHGQVFRLEGPTAVLHFRGWPHVHAFINVVKDAPLSVGPVVAENKAPLEGLAVKRLFERAMRERLGAELAYYDVDAVAGRLRAGVIREGDVYNLESWQDTVRVDHVLGRDLPRALEDELRRTSGEPVATREYTVAVVGKGDVMLRDAVIDHARKHGFA